MAKPFAIQVVYSDASYMGYEGYVVEHDNLVATGLWSAQEAEKSSTWHELQAVWLVLDAFQDNL